MLAHLLDFSPLTLRYFSVAKRLAFHGFQTNLVPVEPEFLAPADLSAVEALFYALFANAISFLG